MKHKLAFFIICTVATCNARKGVGTAATADSFQVQNPGDFFSIKQSNKDDSIPLFQDATKTVEARVHDLLQRMTLQERQVQLYSVHDLEESVYNQFSRTSFGSQKMSKFPQQTPKELQEARNREQLFFLNSSRLKIPISFHQEALTSAGPGGTNFPLHVTLGASFNTSLSQLVGAAIGAEAHALGIDAGYGPEINLYPDPRHGRLQEGFSEDSFLTSEMGVAWVLGMQGPTSQPSPGPLAYLPQGKIACVAKHYMAYGASQGGLDEAPAMLDEYTLRDVYLRAWETLVTRGGLRAAMRAHQAWNHWPLHASTYLAGILNSLGFNNSWTVSDCGDVRHLLGFEVAETEAEAAALALNASVDMENRCGKTNKLYETLDSALEQGLIDEATLNISAARVLRHKFAAGLFDKPFVSPDELEQMRSQPHLQLAQEAASQGVVLLKNAPVPGASLETRPTQHTLPFNLREYTQKTIAVIGPLGGCQDNPGYDPRYCKLEGMCEASCALLGKTFQPLGAGASVPTLYDVLARKIELLPEDSRPRLLFQRGCDVDQSNDTGRFLPGALRLASQADLILLAVGDNIHSCSEGDRMATPHGHGGGGDRDNLDMAGGQQALLRGVIDAKQAHAPLVLVLIHGRPITFDGFGTVSGQRNGLLEGVDAVVSAGRGGEFASAGLLEVLTGRVEPSGRLPQSWPQNVGQIGGPSSPAQHEIVSAWQDDPANQFVRGYYYADASPLFPFGFGLAYTSFKYQSAAFTSLLSADPSEDRSKVLKNAKLINQVVAKVSVKIVNEGARKGFTVVQVYAHDPKKVGVVRYNRRLVAFEKVLIEAQQEVTVEVSITADAFSFVSAPPEYERKLFGGIYRLFIAQHANDPHEISGELHLH